MKRSYCMPLILSLYSATSQTCEYDMSTHACYRPNYLNSCGGWNSEDNEWNCHFVWSKVSPNFSPPEEGK